MKIDFKCRNCSKNNEVNIDENKPYFDFKCSECGFSSTYPMSTVLEGALVKTFTTKKTVVAKSPSSPVASNTIFLVVDKFESRELNAQIANCYPKIHNMCPPNTPDAEFLLKKAIPDKIQTTCYVRNYSIRNEEPILSFRIKNSSFINNYFGQDMQICISGKCIYTGQLAVFNIEIVHSLEKSSKEEIRDVAFSFSTPADVSFAKRLATVISRYEEGIKGDLTKWDEYIKWKQKLAQLKICAAKYIGRRISYDNDGIPNGIDFLAVAQNEDALKKYKEVFRKSRDDMAAYSNDVSTDKWSFSFDSNIKKRVDRGIKLPYIELNTVKNYEAVVSAFNSVTLYDELKRNANGFENPVVFISKFAFNNEDEELFDGERRKPYEERNFEKLNSKILKTIPEEGFISTTRVGDFALYKRLQIALDDLKIGKAVAPNLSTWLFNIKEADVNRDKSSEPVWSTWGESNLNPSQKELITKMLAAKEVFLCQGPPGTGKTTVIAEAVYQMVKSGKRVLIASQTNLAVNNALYVLMKNYPRIRAVRLGDNRKLDDSVANISEGSIVKSYFETSAKSLHEDYIDEWDKVDSEIKKITDGLNALCEISDILQKSNTDAESLEIQKKIDELTQIQKEVLEADDVDLDAIEKLKAIKAEINALKITIKEKTSKLIDENDVLLKTLESEYSCNREELKNVLNDRLVNIKYPSRSINEKYGKYVRDFVDYIEKQDGDFEVENEKYLKQYINSCNVVGVSCTESSMTLTQAGFNSFDVTIIDEVSKATPPELLIPLLLSEKIVLVGDHRQLPPLFSEHINSYEEYIESIDDEDQETKELMTHENYDKFRELVTSSLFKRHFEEAEIENKGSLLIQYRMHREIMDIINYFYNGQLQPGISLEDEKNKKSHHAEIRGVYGVVNPISTKHHAYWVDSSYFYGEKIYEKQSIGSSKTNILEAKLVAKLVREIDESYDRADYKGELDLGIISFYGDQVKLIKKLIPNNKSLKHVVADVNTVDRFQGKEKSIIIVSMVRNVPENKLEHIDPTFVNFYQRINVAFSRAQKLLIIIGAKDMYYNQQIVIEDMDDGTKMAPVNVYGRIIDKLSNNGCFIYADDLLGKEYCQEILEYNESAR